MEQSTLNPHQIQGLMPMLMKLMTAVFAIALFLCPGSAIAAPDASMALNPNNGQDIGFTYEAFLSPQQEPAEEEDTPKFAPKQFLSTAPSVPRNQRPSKGHGIIQITNDLSKAYVTVKAENVNPDDINLFHIHCGRPDVLGPILIDFGLTTGESIQENFADGVFEVELTNKDVEAAENTGEGVVGAFTAGCPIGQSLPDKVKTIAGMQHIAQKGELYFNLHTKGQTFYGEMRGKLNPVSTR